MIRIAESDWEALQSLVGRVGLPAEQVVLLRRRLEESRATRQPLHAAGRQARRRDRSLAGSLASPRGRRSAATDRQSTAGRRPGATGRPAPGSGAWPTWKSGKPPEGHLIVLRRARKPPADITAQLASLGLIEQVVLVCRLFQAMHGDERELVEAFAPLAATARVLLVWQPGEQPSDKDLAEVPASAVHQLRQHGFDAGRGLGAGIWFAGESCAEP